MVKLMTIQEAARYLQRCEATVYLAIKEGRLRAHRVLGRLGVTRRELDRYRRDAKQGRPPKAKQ